MQSSSRQLIEHTFSSYSTKRISKGNFDINDLIPTAPVLQSYSRQHAANTSNKRIINSELNGNTGIILPQVLKKQNHTIILDRDLPNDLKRIDIDSKQFNQDEGFDSFACVIPINKQFGRKLNGMRLKYGEKLVLHSDRQGNLKKLKKNLKNERMVNDLKSELSKSQRIGTIQSFLYIAEDETYFEQDNKMVDYQALLFQKEDKILELQHMSNVLRNKLRTLGHQDHQIPKVVYSEQRQMLYKMGQNLQTILDKYPQEKKSIDSSVKLFIDSQLSVETLTSNILRYRDSRLGQFSQIMLLLGNSLNKIFKEYPKLMDKVDAKVLTFISSDFMRTAANSKHRIVDIVQYVPQTVRVQDVYTHARYKEQSQRLTWHLKILIKKLLDQLLRIKVKTGVDLDLEQAVFQMIERQTSEIINVQELLRVFRPVPEIEQVDRIFEKAVSNFIDLPQVKTLITHTEYPVQMRDVQPFERIVNHQRVVYQPIQLKRELLKIVKDIAQQVIAVPTRYEVPVQIIRQVPKIEQVVVERDRIIQKEIVLPMPQRIIQKEVQKTKIQTFKEQIPIQPDRLIVQILKEVPVLVDKIVILKQEVPKMVPQTRIVENKVYHIEKEIRNNIQNQIQVHKEFIEILVPVQNRVEVIKEVDKLIQKPVYLNRTDEVVLEVEVIREVPIYTTKVQIVEKIVPVPFRQEVVRQVTAIVENYNYVQVVKPVDRIIQVPVHSHTENTVHVPVNLEVPVILYKDQIIQIDRIINHEVIHEKPVNIIEQKIVQIQQYFERIKQVMTVKQKIVQRIVEVPKVVQVEKIVQKIIVVPRVIDRIVTVEKVVQIPVEVIVEKIIIKEIQKIVQKPVFIQKIVPVQTINNVIQRQQIPVLVIEEVLMTDLREITKVETRQLQKQKIVIQRHQVPRDRIVQKLVPLVRQVPKFIDKPEIIQVPVEKEVPLIQQKVVPLVSVQDKPVQVVRVVEKIVTLKDRIEVLKQVQRNIQKIVIDERIKIVEDRVPYPVLQIVQIPTEIYVELTKEVPKEIRTYQEKLVDRQVKVVQQVGYKIQVQRPVVQQKIVELREIVPRIVEVPKIIEVINNQFKEIHILYERLKEIQLIQQVPVITQKTSQSVVKQQLQIEKLVIQEKIEKVIDRVEVIRDVIQNRQSTTTQQVPVIVQKDRLVERPTFVQEIVQQIILLPQLVEVMKYVHEVIQTDGLVKVQGDIGEKEMSLRLIAGNLQTQIGLLLTNLQSMKNDPKNIQMIKKFLIEMRTFVALPRIHQIIKQVETKQVRYKDRYVQVPSGHEDTLSKNLLIESLIIQIKRLKKQNPGLRLDLSDDIMYAFFTNETGQQWELNDSLVKYAQNIESRFRSQGSWNRQQQQFLNGFLIERFSVLQQLKALTKSSQNQKIQYSRKIDKLKKDNQQLIRWLKQLPSLVNSGNQQQANLIINNLNEKYLTRSATSIFDLANSRVDNSDLKRQISRLRAIENQHKNCMSINERERLRKIAMDHDVSQRTIQSLRLQIERLQHQISNMDHGSSERIIESLRSQVERLQMQISSLNRVTGKRYVGSTALNSPVQVTSAHYSKSRGTESGSDYEQNYGQNYQNYQFTSNNDIGIAEGQTRQIGSQMRSSYQHSSSKIESNRQMVSSHASEARRIGDGGSRQTITQYSHSKEYIPREVGNSSSQQVQSQRHVYSTAVQREGYDRNSIGSSSITGKYIKMTGSNLNMQSPRYQGQGSRKYYKKQQN